ncbi:serpin-Z3-like [Chenopodium quinoa]|uniref:serpin-Z3-like n=1 Tax=Chenopodium quinoa TaxID=63459 RepID=UPI000B78F54E|nr:serpin-Z3-like [Chenopodium quinoa]
MNFSLKVANHVLQKSLTENNNSPMNVILSPLSIDAVLNILALRCHGPTLEQLLELLGCNDVKEFNEMASGLADVLKESKGDDCDEVKQVVNEVNIWAEAMSKGFIKQIISENLIAKDTMLILLNAMYFKGTWVNRFKTEHTEDADFYLLNGNKVEVPFINKTYTGFEYGTFERCQVLRMLYNEEEVEKGEKARSFSIAEGREDVLDTPIPVLTATSSDAEKASQKVVKDKSVFVTCLMLASMEPNLQKKFDGMDTHSIIQQLKKMFQKQARIERYENHRELLRCVQKVDEPLGEHVFKMMELFKKMSKLGITYTTEMATDIIMMSLHDGFQQFGQNLRRTAPNACHC